LTADVSALVSTSGRLSLVVGSEGLRGQPKAETRKTTTHFLGKKINKSFLRMLLTFPPTYGIIDYKQKKQDTLKIKTKNVYECA
jgi:hypothetical protein